MSALDDAAREIHQEGYEEGCNDGYRKALEDVLDLVNELGHAGMQSGDLFRELEQLRKRAR